MTDKELRKLRRTDLLELLIAQTKENEELRAKLQKNEEKLMERKIALDEAGSIAAAALKINGVFEDAQKAASQYLENIEHLSERQQAICQKRDSENKIANEKKAEETKAYCLKLEEDTKRKCDAMVAQAKKESREYWEEVSKKFAALIEAQKGLKELFSVMAQKR